MYSEILCIALVIIIGATMFYYNSITDWDYTVLQDWLIIIGTNLSALFLIIVLLLTATIKESYPND